MADVIAEVRTPAGALVSRAVSADIRRVGISAESAETSAAATHGVAGRRRILSAALIVFQALLALVLMPAHQRRGIANTRTTGGVWDPTSAWDPTSVGLLSIFGVQSG